jgi:hypothetical protein
VRTYIYTNSPTFILKMESASTSEMSATLPISMLRKHRRTEVATEDNLGCDPM